MFLAVTIDTEADNQWDFGAPLTIENAAYWPAFQEICDRHGVPPTYLLTSEVAGDPAATELVKGWVNTDRAEVGAHLHAWTTPPFSDEDGLRFNDPSHAYLSELPTELIRLKLNNLTREIEQGVGVRPTSFRSGRFGFDARCAAALCESGYEVDSSVTPLTRWTAHPGLPQSGGGPDFTSHVAQPFVIRGTPPPGLLELPVTIVTTYRVLRRSPSAERLYRSFPLRPLRNRLLGRWLRPQPIWLNPTPWFTVDDLVAAWTECRRMGGEVAVMMFHSSELMPGASPYRPTPASVDQLLADLDTFFARLRGLGARFTTLTDAARSLRATHPLSVRDL